MNTTNLRNLACRDPPVQGSMLDKHKLSLQFSKRKAGAGGAGAGGAKGGKAKGGDEPAEGGSTKLVVRNLAFEATKK